MRTVLLAFLCAFAAVASGSLADRALHPAKALERQGETPVEVIHAYNEPDAPILDPVTRHFVQYHAVYPV